ncbi:hypothetical protein M408DRAFT_25811 [Serendipita vermifera MAFF 305830]|uniref:HNH nuclease domain-containing protein n=1 Tax=Serendipita vermifera MAFF 305830 TaxID=933852 RepID=A0A0C2WHQ4_SERVB|nr:hypothetical protein M408DRAFT_25811 [Serendipita vermifera MAFF 305830]
MEAVDNTPKRNVDFSDWLLKGLYPTITPIPKERTQEVGDKSVDWADVLQCALSNAPDQESFVNELFKTTRVILKSQFKFDKMTVKPKDDQGWTRALEEVAKEPIKGQLHEKIEEFAGVVISLILLSVYKPASGPRPKKKKKKKDEDDIKREASFRSDLLKRDSGTCVVTGVISDSRDYDGRANLYPNQDRGVVEGAHIIPLALAANNVEKENIRSIIATFAGPKFLERFEHDVNDVRNGMILDLNCHKSFDKLQWSIKATQIGVDKYEYKIQRTRPDEGVNAGTSSSLVEHNKVLEFASTAPDPVYCNLHLAVSLVVQAKGLADIFDTWPDEDEESTDPVPGTSKTDEEVALERSDFFKWITSIRSREEVAAGAA